MEQKFEELYAKRLEIKASIIEVQIIVTGLQTDINGYMEKLVELGELLLASGMDAPESAD